MEIAYTILIVLIAMAGGFWIGVAWGKKNLKGREKELKNRMARDRGFEIITSDSCITFAKVKYQDPEKAHMQVSPWDVEPELKEGNAKKRKIRPLNTTDSIDMNIYYGRWIGVFTELMANNHSGNEQLYKDWNTAQKEAALMTEKAPVAYK